MTPKTGLFLIASRLSSCRLASASSKGKRGTGWACRSGESGSFFFRSSPQSSHWLRCLIRVMAWAAATSTIRPNRVVTGSRADLVPQGNGFPTSFQERPGTNDGSPDSSPAAHLSTERELSNSHAPRSGSPMRGRPRISSTTCGNATPWSMASPAAEVRARSPDPGSIK